MSLLNLFPEHFIYKGLYNVLEVLGEALFGVVKRRDRLVVMIECIYANRTAFHCMHTIPFMASI